MIDKQLGQRNTYYTDVQTWQQQGKQLREEALSYNKWVVSRVIPDIADYRQHSGDGSGFKGFITVPKTLY